MPIKSNDPFGDTQHNHCNSCGMYLHGWSFSEQVDAEWEFRHNFPQTWPHLPRVLMCDKCFARAKRDEPPEDWDANNAWRFS